MSAEITTFCKNKQPPLDGPAFSFFSGISATAQETVHGSLAYKLYLHMRKGTGSLAYNSM